ncbi:MAG: CDP-alcohol phosphatidyltransferase family protein [Opitutales bacterium]
MPWLPPTLSFALALASFLALCGWWRRWQKCALPAADAARLVKERGHIVETGLIAPFYVALNPVANSLARLRCDPAWLTLAGLFAAMLTVATLWAGFWTLALWLLLMHGVLDALDGAVARRRRCQSPRGERLDRTADRLSEGLILAAVALVALKHAGAWMLPMAVLLAVAVWANVCLGCSPGFCRIPVLARRGWRLGAVGVILGFQITTDAVAEMIPCPVFWPFPTGLCVLSLGSAWGRYCWKRRLTFDSASSTVVVAGTHSQVPEHESPSTALVETP